MMDVVWYCEFTNVKPHIESKYDKCSDREFKDDALDDVKFYHDNGCYTRLVYEVKNMGYKKYEYPCY